MRTALALLAIGLTACDGLQFVAPGAVPPSLYIGVIVRHDSMSHILLGANMNQGRDADGHPTVLSDSSIYVNGTTVAPELRSNSQGQRWFAYSWSADHLANAIAESLLVIGPMSTADAAAPVIRIVIPARQDPQSIALPASTDLRLHVTTAAATGIPPAASQTWELRLASGCAEGSQYLRISAQGSYPAELRVPFDQLPNNRPLTVMACFHSFAYFSPTQVPYRTYVSIQSDMQWTIQLQP